MAPKKPKPVPPPAVTAPGGMTPHEDSPTLAEPITITSPTYPAAAKGLCPTCGHPIHDRCSVCGTEVKHG